MFFIKLISRLPLWILYGFSDVIYFLTFRVVRYRKKVVVQNLKLAFPEKNDAEIKKLTKSFYRNFGDFTIETLKLLTISPQEIEKMVAVEGLSLVEEYFKKKDVILIMSNHLNSWELIPPRAAQTGIPCDVIYKTLSNKFFDNLMLTIRSRFGVKPVKMQQILREIVKRKSEPRIIGIISDQAAETPEVAYWTTFLNQETDFFTGTEKIARSFNYPVVYAELVRLKRGKYLLKFMDLVKRPYDKIPQNGITEMYVKALEKSIRENPADWLWSHRRFKHKRVL